MGETITFFGRYAPLMDVLAQQTDLPVSAECLVIGAGKLDLGRQDIIASYQPFEVVSSLAQSGCTEPTIHIIDNHPDVISQFDPPLKSMFPWKNRSRQLMIEAAHARQMFRRIYLAHANYPFDDYLERFFPAQQRWQGREAYINVGQHMAERFKPVEVYVDVGQLIANRFKPVWADIRNYTLPESFYDLVVCTEVLGYIEPRREEVTDRIIRALKIGGYLLTNNTTSLSNSAQLDPIATFHYNELVLARKSQ